MKALKERVKKGDVTPEQAKAEAEELARKSPAVKATKTYKWLKKKLGLKD